MSLRKFFIASATVLALVSSAAPPATADQQKVLFRARDRVLPALVHVQPILQIYRSGRQENVAVTGSGVIISKDGYVLTNAHVVENAKRVTCTLSSRQEVEANVVGTDPLSDLAVLKIDPSYLTGAVAAAPLGDSDKLEVGEMVMAMGSPLGLARSVSMGVVSSLNRYIPEGQLPSGTPTGRYNTWIQTDAAINPGNSGGPLVNLKGEVIGINARAIPVVGENLGFAIPINLARDVARQLISSGNISRSWIGVTFQALQPLASYLGVPPDRGAVVASVVGGSPAAEAGLQAGDVLTQWGTRDVVARYDEDLPLLEKLIADTGVGQGIDLSYVRDGKNASAHLVTREQPKVEAREVECREWGFTAQEITQEAARALKILDPKGVIVSGVRRDSFADDAGLRHGDILVNISGKPVEGLEGFRNMCKSMTDSKTDRVLAEVRRGRVVYYHLLKPWYRGAPLPVPPPTGSAPKDPNVPEGSGSGGPD